MPAKPPRPPARSGCPAARLPGVSCFGHVFAGALVRAPGMSAVPFSYRCEVETRSGKVLDAMVGGNQTTGLDVSADGRLLATYKDGRAHLDAYLDDHAYLLAALIEIMQARIDVVNRVLPDEGFAEAARAYERVLEIDPTQDTAVALDQLRRHTNADIAVVCAQNGVENERLALRQFPRDEGAAACRQQGGAWSLKG